MTIRIISLEHIAKLLTMVVYFLYSMLLIMESMDINVIT